MQIDRWIFLANEFYNIEFMELKIKEKVFLWHISVCGSIPTYLLKIGRKTTTAKVEHCSQQKHTENNPMNETNIIWQIFI